jgi:hypothetical protein
MNNLTREIIEDNYHSKVAPFLVESRGCLLYSKVTVKRPYGHIAITASTRSTTYSSVHGLSYLYHNNKTSTEGLHVLHSCDTPACCNPKHLRLGTNQDNVDDRVSRGRSVNRKGSANPNTNLSEKNILQIYLAKGTYRSIAGNCGIALGIVGRIKRKDTWKELTDAYDELMI